MSSSNQKSIFQYYNGKRSVWGDPLEIEDMMNYLLAGEPGKVTDQTNVNDPEVYVPATNRLVEAVREAFKMAPFDEATGEGATRQDCLDASNAYLRYKKSLKKSTADPSTSPPASEE